MVEAGRLAGLLIGKDHGGIVAVRADTRITRAEFLAQVAGWRSALASHPARRLALFDTDTAHFSAALFGAWAAGKSLVLPGDALPGTVAALRGQVDAFIGAFDADTLPIPRPDARPGDIAALPVLDAEACHLAVFTSGSSGEPVAIPKRLSQLSAEVDTLEALFGASLGHAIVRGTVSHQHIYGLLFRLLLPLAAGRPFDAHALRYPEDIIGAANQGPFALVASPAHLARLPDTVDWSPLSGVLRRVFSSGGPLLPDAALRAERCLGCAPIEIYGSSETGGIATRVRRDDGDLWQPMPHVAIATDASQRLTVRSPHLPDDTAFVCADRVLIEGERFALLGRVDRIVKVEEKRVSLDAIEAHLCAVPQVAAARALMTEHAGRRQLAAVVVPTAAGHALIAAHGKRALNEVLRAHLAQHVEAVALPRRWRYVCALPVNSQGKTPHADLLELFADAHERPTKPGLTVITRNDTDVQLHWLIPEDLVYFDGHFPTAPVLAGVVQLDWVIHYGRAFFPLPPNFRRVDALKFQRVIQPGYTLRVALTFDAKAGTLGFKISSPDGARGYSSGRVVFGEAE
ncbi:MAG: AMP-binding protein [Rhodocyclaceae bacterium]